MPTATVSRTCSAAIFLAFVVAMVFGPGVVMAHHSFALFDTGKTVSVSGSVTSFEWTNPHAYIEMDVSDARGGMKHWSVEMGSPSILMQSGWKFKDLKFGDKVTVTLNPLRSGQSGGLLIQATLADGRVLGNGPGRGPAGPAAPAAAAPAAPAAPAGR